MYIPEKFVREDENSPVAYTVKDLIELLMELPPYLPVVGPWSSVGQGARLTVYNSSGDWGQPHLVLEENEYDT